jgi:8-amino-7-oxononanoate synthase
VSPGPLSFLDDELGALERACRLRVRPGPVGSEALNLCSNDYLGLVSGGRLSDAAREAAARVVVGAGASRLVFGEHEAHRSLETALARWLCADETLVFSSGYACNVGLLPALAGPGDRVVSDVLNHASIVDGCRLTRADVVVVPHCDLVAVERALAAPSAGRRWVVTESYFSMDGDGPDLTALRSICDRAGAGLIVDEAHALGVFGPEGRGRCAEAGKTADVLIGTLGKAFGAQGAFVAGSSALCRWLWNRARSFVYSTGVSPLLCSVAEAAVELVRQDESARERLLSSASVLRGGLRELGLPVRVGFGPIIPMVVGSELAAVRWADRLRARGVLVQAIRPPTVPDGSARLRITASAGLTTSDISRALKAFADARSEVEP